MDSDSLHDFVFVTGFPRSGTTLVDRMLDTATSVRLLSQPLPLMFVEAKRAFLRSQDKAMGGQVQSSYPLNDMFLENWYPIQSFTEYLASTQFDRRFFSSVLEEMQSFTGQYSKICDTSAALAEFEHENLATFLKRYLGFFHGVQEASRFGIKETNCEEFLPFFLQAGATCVLVVRDPRDAITSANFGRGQEYTGRPKPLLFNIRQWRKSISFAIAFSKNPNVCIIKYEDLVSAPRGQLQRLSTQIDAPDLLDVAWEQFADRREHNSLPSNSSHAPKRGVDQTSVGRFEDVLPRNWCNLIEICCMPEMMWLGYCPRQDVRSLGDRLRQIKIEETLARPQLAHYEWGEARYREESARLQKLVTDDITATGAEASFLLEGVGEALSATFRAYLAKGSSV